MWKCCMQLCGNKNLGVIMCFVVLSDRASITSNFLIKLVISQTAILCSACYFSKPTDVPSSRVNFLLFHLSSSHTFKYCTLCVLTEFNKIHDDDDDDDETTRLFAAFVNVHRCLVLFLFLLKLIFTVLAVCTLLNRRCTRITGCTRYRYFIDWSLTALSAQ